MLSNTTRINLIYASIYIVFLSPSNLRPTIQFQLADVVELPYIEPFCCRDRNNSGLDLQCYAAKYG